MNAADNESGSKAIDSLINYETVKVCYIIMRIIIVICNLRIYCLNSY